MAGCGKSAKCCDSPGGSDGPAPMTRHARFAAVAVVVAAGLAAIGTPVNAQDDGAFANLRARAEAGDSEAQYSLGIHLQSGHVVPQDLTAAETWLLRAAETGHLDAQFALGLLYDKASEHAEAVAWLLRAAGQDHRDAHLILALYYQGCNGEPRDDVEAVAWLRTAAEAGHAPAMSVLADLYARGRGVIKDPVLACMWQFLAAYRSSGRNRDQMVRMAKLMARELPRAERHEALRLAAEWDAAHPQ